MKCVITCACWKRSPDRGIAHALVIKKLGRLGQRTLDYKEDYARDKFLPFPNSGPGQSPCRPRNQAIPTSIVLGCPQSKASSDRQPSHTWGNTVLGWPEHSKQSATHVTGQVHLRLQTTSSTHGFVDRGFMGLILKHLRENRKPQEKDERL